MDNIIGQGVDFMSETWRPIVQFNKQLHDGRWLYEVSDIGRVRRISYVDENGNQHKEFIYKDQSRISFYANGHSKSFSIHMLVAAAFVENPDGLKSVIHIDGNTDNNVASNLQWGRRKTGRPRAIRQYSQDGKLIAEYPMAVEACRLLGLSYNSLWYHCVSQSSTLYADSFWRFVDKDEISDSGVVPVTQEVVEDYIRKYDFNGKLLAVFPSVAEAAASVGAHTTSIENCCFRISVSSFGYIWRFKTDDEIAEGKPVPKVPTNKKAVRQYTENGEFIAEYESVSDAYKQFGKPPQSGISNCCNRKQGAYSCFGYIWRFAEDDELYKG